MNEIGLRRGRDAAMLALGASLALSPTGNPAGSTLMSLASGADAFREKKAHELTAVEKLLTDAGIAPERVPAMTETCWRASRYSRHSAEEIAAGVAAMEADGYEAPAGFRAEVRWNPVEGMFQRYVSRETRQAKRARERKGKS